MQLTLQTFNDGHWQDAFVINIATPEAGKHSRVSLQANTTYAAAYFDETGSRSFSAMYPVNPMDVYSFNSWPGVFEDIMPMGYARTIWLNILGMQQQSVTMQDIALLRAGTIAPVGNLRLKESVEMAAGQQVTALQQMRFEQQQVIERNHDFLNYARQRGAVSGGATGAGGAAPKLLVRLSPQHEVWIDTLQNDNSPDEHYLVKFPRGNTAIDQDILRAEYHYYCELAELGFTSMDVTKLQLHEGSKQPSLWLPRFDREFSANAVQRYGVESVFSLLNKPAGSHLKHEEVLKVLTQVVNDQTTAALTAEYLKRDLLNLVFGNSDNHGRNMAVLKNAAKVSLAPIYDFAPMKADPEVVIRTTHWSNTFERGGDIDWLRLCDNLACYGEPELFKTELRQLAAKLQHLAGRLTARGVPESIMQMPVMGFAYLETRLQQWGLLA